MRRREFFGVLGVTAVWLAKPLGSVEADAGPPAISLDWPSGWDDPWFANNIDSSPPVKNSGSTVVTWQNLTINDQSGNPTVGYGNYKLINCRMRTREGPRLFR